MVDLDEFVEPLLGVFRAFLLIEDLIRCRNGIRGSDFGPAKSFMMIMSAVAIADHCVESASLMAAGLVLSRVRWWRH